MYLCCRLTTSRAWSGCYLAPAVLHSQDNTGCSKGHQLDSEEPQESLSLPKVTARLSHLSSPLEPRELTDSHLA